MSNLNLPPQAIAAIDRGEWIEAIKLVREHTGLGLKEAKDAVERYRNGDRSPLGVAAGTTEDFDEAFAPPVHQSTVDRSMRNVMADPMAEPGRVRGTFLSSPVFWLVLLAIAVIAWRFFKPGE